jgi:hypothetical protein
MYIASYVPAYEYKYVFFSHLAMDSGYCKECSNEYGCTCIPWYSDLMWLGLFLNLHACGLNN